MMNGVPKPENHALDAAVNCISYNFVSDPNPAARLRDAVATTVCTVNRPSSDLAGKSAATADLEIKDAQLIFNRVWKQLEKDYGREKLRFPKELILLGGAPGAGG